MQRILTDIEFSKFAIANYDNPSCVDVREFQEDMKRLMRLNRYLSNIEDWSPSICRRILNNLIIIYNIFGNNAEYLLDYKINIENKPKLRALQHVIGRLTTEDIVDLDLLRKLECL